MTKQKAKHIKMSIKKCIHCGKNVTSGDNFKYGIFDEPMHRLCVRKYNAKISMGHENEERKGVMNDDYTDYHQKAQSEEEFLYYKENGWC